jgi:Lrp/AsnC family transcriptional regulator for asnA, asnC and gidA
LPEEVAAEMGVDVDKIRHIQKISQDTVSLEAPVGSDDDESSLLADFIADEDYSKLGYDLTAVIGVIVKGGHLPEIEEKIARETNVSAVYDVTGQYDAIVVAKFRNRDELNKLVKKLTALENIDRTYTMVVLNVVKEQHGVGL